MNSLPRFLRSPSIKPVALCLTALALAACADRPPTAPDLAPRAEVVTASPFEGCQVSYWRQTQHYDSWAGTGYSPNTSLGSVFSVVVVAFPSLAQDELSVALQYHGGAGVAGAARRLLKQGVAALLNASHPNIDYPLSAAQVVADVNAALASGDRETMLAVAARLADLNNSGCPLS